MLVAYGEGLTSGDVASVLNLEVVYHFEGIPVISAGLVPSGQAVAVSSPGAAAAVHQMISSLPIGHTVREKAEHIAAHGLNLAERRAGRVIKEAWSGFKARQASNLMATMGMVAL